MSAASADKGKKPRVDAEEDLPVDQELVQSIEKLQAVQDELEKVNEEASDKVLEVEQKYNELRRPVYVKRQDIIQTIPDFWLTAFLSHPLLSDLLSENDQKVFKYLDHLDVEDCKDVKSGYSIILNFKSNPYFEETKLSKTYRFAEDGTTTINATTITWKDGMNISNGNAEKKGNKRSLVDESFFTWFADVQNKVPEGVQDEIAEIIKEDLWPNPLKYFNHDGEDEMYGDGDGDGDDDDDDGEEEEAFASEEEEDS